MAQATARGAYFGEVLLVVFLVVFLRAVVFLEVFFLDEEALFSFFMYLHSW